MANLKSTVNLICMYLNCGRKLQYVERTHADVGSTSRCFKARGVLLSGDGSSHLTTLLQLSSMVLNTCT